MDINTSSQLGMLLLEPEEIEHNEIIVQKLSIVKPVDILLINGCGLLTALRIYHRFLPILFPVPIDLRSGLGLLASDVGLYDLGLSALRNEARVPLVLLDDA